jgi:hypothetical protein
MALDEEPVGARAALPVMAKPHQHPAALQLFPGQCEAQLALSQGLGGIALCRPEAPVPEHDSPAAILAFGYGPFEIAIVEGVVLGLYGQALVLRIERRPLGRGPGLEHAIDFEAEIIVQPRRGMLLHDKAGVLRGSDLSLAARLGRLREIPLLLVER